MKWLPDERQLATAAEHAGSGSPWVTIWTFPAMIGAAFVVAWGAEAAEFLISQGLALALLALIQTMPEFAVEAVNESKPGFAKTHRALGYGIEDGSQIEGRAADYFE